MYTVKITIRIRGTKRLLRSFIRPEYALNTSSHATVFDSIQDAETVADKQAEIARANGHTFIGVDFYEVKK
jgi:hypothetical protein